MHLNKKTNWNYSIFFCGILIILILIVTVIQAFASPIKQGPVKNSITIHNQTPVSLTDVSYSFSTENKETINLGTIESGKTAVILDAPKSATSISLTYTAGMQKQKTIHFQNINVNMILDQYLTITANMQEDGSIQFYTSASYNN